MDKPVALVTGAAQGIGLATARRLAATHRVALLDLDAEQLPAAAASCGSGAVGVVCDITDPGQVDAAIADVVAQAGGIDVIVSNAGVAITGALRLIDPDAVAAAMNVNLIGNWRTIHAALPHIIERRGYVVGVTSAAAIAPTAGLGAYCASKAGLEMLLDVLRVEVAHLGVDVGVAYFLWIDTDMVRGAERETPAFRELREAQPGPLRKVHPVGAAADAIVAGIARRSRRIYTPGWLAGLSPARMALRSRIAEREARKGALIVDEQTALQVAEKGARDAASRHTKAGDAALASVDRG